MNRRKFLSVSVLGMTGAAIAACTTTTTGTVTTASIDTARITADIDAVINSLTAVLAAPAMVTVLGASYAQASAALADATATEAKLKTLVAGGVTATVDTATVQSFTQTVISDVQKGIALAQGVLSGLTSANAVTIQNWLSAASALIPFIELAAMLASAPKAVAGGMSESDALAMARSASVAKAKAIRK